MRTLTRPPTKDPLVHPYKLVATFMCRHLQQQTLTHTLVSPCDMRASPATSAPATYTTLRARSKSSYSLYIDFDKAFNSVPLSTLWTVLEHSNLSRAAITSAKNLYASPVDAPKNIGHGPHSYVQVRGLRHGCPNSPLLFIIYLNSLFSYFVYNFLATNPPPEKSRITSPHAFIDDILIRSEDPSYIQRAINLFDGPARFWVVDMHV